MSSLEKQTLPPSAIAPTPATNVQVIEDASTAKHRGTETVDESESASVAEKKKAESGLTSYLVSATTPKTSLHDADTRSESLFVRNKVRYVPRSAQLYHLDRCRYCVPIDGMIPLH